MSLNTSAYFLAAENADRRCKKVPTGYLNSLRVSSEISYYPPKFVNSYVNLFTYWQFDWKWARGSLGRACKAEGRHRQREQAVPLIV